MGNKVLAFLAKAIGTVLLQSSSLCPHLWNDPCYWQGDLRVF